jgi:hypothetical protein
MTKTTADFDYAKLADSTYENCIIYRKLENKLMNGIQYTYSVSYEVQEALEQADPTGKQLEKFCTNLEKVEQFDTKTQQERDEHMAKCEICLPYWEALQVSRGELQK